MKILFAFENTLPSNEADAEVFVTTARYLAPLTSGSWLHVPLPNSTDPRLIDRLAGMSVIRACAPVRPAALRHLACGLTMVFRIEYRQADVVYTRNLWVAWMAVAFGQCVVFDHYRPWSGQIPPLQPWIYHLICKKNFLINICHSDYTREKYLELGVPGEKVCCIHNGFEPRRLQVRIPRKVAKEQIGVAPGRRTVVYTGRLNHKKGLDLVIEAAKRLPDILFILVGSYGAGPIESMASTVTNIRIVPWQPPEMLGSYLFAADILLIPPSWKPLATFGSTVLPLKLFLYMASGTPILAGNTSDVREVLRHRENALLCRPDCLEALVAGIDTLTKDMVLATRLAATALVDSQGFTWQARAQKIIDLVEDRLRFRRSEHGSWSGTQRREWIHQSWRWLVHLVRERSWVLPPDVASSVTPLHAGASE